MALGACGKLSEWILHILNTVLLLVGIAMLSLGLWLRYNDGTKGLFEMAEMAEMVFSTSAFVTGVTVLITLGSVLLGVVAFGCVSTCTGNRWGLGLYTVLLALLAGSVAVLGVLAYARRDEVGAELLEFYGTVYTLFLAMKDPALAVTITLFHTAFHCCGTMGGLLEVDAVKQTCPKPSGVWEMSLGVPACLAVIPSAIESKAPVVMGVFLGTGGVLLAALVCTVILIRNIKKGGRRDYI